MNKQELIDELAKYVKSYENAMDEHGQGRYGAYEVSLKLVKRLNESKITDEQAWNKVAEAYPESAQSLRNTLDNAVFGKTGEPQKPVVPKFVAEWFEEKEGGLENAIFYECVRVTDTYSKDYSEFQRWLVSAENNPIETLVRMKDGYEVEKEPRWVVKLPNDYYFSSWVSLYSLEADGATYKFYDDVFVFDDRTKAEAVATLVDGSVEEV
ncbi:TPA: DUF1642 domain-containing protein [Enterococcus faecium]